MEIQNKIEENKEGNEEVIEENNTDSDISGVTAGMPYLNAKDYKDGQIVRNVKILEFIAHNEERIETVDGKEKKYKENWIIKVETKKDETKTEYFLRLNSKMVVAMRDELNFGDNIRDWAGKVVDLIVKEYNVGKGFLVAI